MVTEGYGSYTEGFPEAVSYGGTQYTDLNCKPHIYIYIWRRPETPFTKVSIHGNAGRVRWT